MYDCKTKNTGSNIKTVIVGSSQVVKYSSVSNLTCCFDHLEMPSSDEEESRREGSLNQSFGRQNVSVNMPRNNSNVSSIRSPLDSFANRRTNRLAFGSSTPPPSPPTRSQDELKNIMDNWRSLNNEENKAIQEYYEVKKKRQVVLIRASTLRDSQVAAIKAEVNNERELRNRLEAKVRTLEARLTRVEESRTTPEDRSSQEAIPMPE